MDRRLLERIRRFLPIILVVAGAVAIPLVSVGCRTTPLSGESLVAARCTECHTLAPIEVARKTPQEWEATVYSMIGKGAHLNDSEARQVIEFLSETYGMQ